MTDAIEYKIKVETGTIMVDGWTEGYVTVDGFRVPAPKWIVRDDKVMDFKDWQKSITKQDKE